MTRIATDFRTRIASTAGVGFAVGVAGGLIGLGGAELRLPYLLTVLALLPRAAVPVNLAVSLVTVLASLPLRIAGVGVEELLPWLTVVIAIAGGAMAAAWVGAGWLQRIDASTLARAIGVLLASLGVVLLLEAVVQIAPAGMFPDGVAARLVIAIIAGLVIGTISSLLGVAGGEVIIPTLVIGYGIPVAIAGTLSLMISVPTILVGLVRHWRAKAFQHAEINRYVILPLSIGAVSGAVVGSASAALVAAGLVKAILGLLLIWSAFKVARKH